MLIILVVFSLITKSDSQTPDSCFYTERFTFFKGNSVASPQRMAGYNFNVSWESTQASIVNSSIFYTVSRNQRYIPLSYQANIISTTHAGATIWINPINGSQILSITMNIVLLKSCSGTARLIQTQLSSLFLGTIWYNFSIDAGITFRRNIQNYKYEIFVTDFDGYPINGSTNFAFFTMLKPLSLNTNLHQLYIYALPGPFNANFTYVNRLRYTYVVVDITSFLITPITQNHFNSWLSNQIYINVNKDFGPLADKKCMVGIRGYILFYPQRQDYNISIMMNSTNYSLTYMYSKAGNNFVPTLFCIGFCKEGTGRSTNNDCVPCPNISTTCSNQSYILTCIGGYYPQPTVTGVQKCFHCMPGCKICTNYTVCIQCQPPNLLTKENNCQKCPSKSWLAGGICSSVPGCSRAQSIGGQSVCMSCNPQQNFYMYPINSKCVCKSGHDLKDGKCIGYCGDGIIIDEECDDSNSVNSDGCSLECKQEKGYKCSNKTSNSPSICVFKNKISIELISIKRINFQNRIVLIFKTLPVYFNGLSADFIKSHIQTNLSVIIESLTVKGRFITVQMSFDEDIDQKSALFRLNFNNTLIAQRQVSLLVKFKANQKLLKFHKIKLAKTIKYLFSSVSLCAILLFLVSLRFHKMIGLQTVLPFQIIYFVFLLTQQKTQLFTLFEFYAGSALNFLYYFNGSSFIQSSISEDTYASDNRNMCLIIVICVSYTIFSISLISYILYFLKNQSSKCSQKVERFTIFWHNRVSLPIFSLFMVPFFVLKSVLSTNKNEVRFDKLLLVFQCLIIVLVIFYQWRAAFKIKSSFIQSIQNYHSYIPTLLGFIFIVSFVLSASFFELISFLEPLLLSLFLLSLIVFIYFRPYKGIINNTGVIVGLVHIIFFLSWGIIRRLQPLAQTQENQVFGLFITFGLAASNIIIGFTRVFLEALQQYRKKTIKKAEENSVSLGQKKYTEINWNQTKGMQVRYETKLILPKHINIDFIETVPLQHFNSAKKDSTSQLKKTLMQKIKQSKKEKQCQQSFQN